jgi:hypothetical protein
MNSKTLSYTVHTRLINSDYFCDSCQYPYIYWKKSNWIIHIRLSNRGFDKWNESTLFIEPFADEDITEIIFCGNSNFNRNFETGVLLNTSEIHLFEKVFQLYHQNPIIYNWSFSKELSNFFEKTEPFVNAMLQRGFQLEINRETPFYSNIEICLTNLNKIFGQNQSRIYFKWDWLTNSITCISELGGVWEDSHQISLDDSFFDKTGKSLTIYWENWELIKGVKPTGLENLLINFLK